MNCTKLMEDIEVYLKSDLCKNLDEANAQDLHHALSKAIMSQIADSWKESKKLHTTARHAYYMSAEFLIGRAIYNNLLCLGIYDEVEKMFKERGLNLADLEEVEDASLGNGGLGRLAACFLDSAATLELPLDGYGIRYKYGLFKQYIQDGFQMETADDWTRFGDPWSIRRLSALYRMTCRLSVMAPRTSATCVCGRQNRFLPSISTNSMHSIMKHRYVKRTVQRIFPVYCIRMTPQMKVRSFA